MRAGQLDTFADRAVTQTGGLGADHPDFGVAFHKVELQLQAVWQGDVVGVHTCQIRRGAKFDDDVRRNIAAAIFLVNQANARIGEAFEIIARAHRSNRR